MDNQRMENAQMNILKCFIAQMDSAMKIASIISDHSETKELDGDCVISGLVYRLMKPMSDEEMYSSLNKANDIMNGDISDDSDYDTEDEEELLEESNKFDEELKDKSWRKIRTNNCQCDVCSRVRECLNMYKTYEVYEPLANKFKNAIENTCNTHKIIIE
tara:strand:- start:657 stop:1136 length:480 start_codon:yes stop_codon:yes gene_type:complete